MAIKKFDISKIQDEISSRKKSNGLVETANGGVARDGFLNELVTSLTTGRESSASNVIRAVEHKVAVKSGETRQPLPEVAIPKGGAPQQANTQRIQLNEMNGGMSPERDEMMYMNIEKNRKSTLGDSIANLVGRENLTNGVHNNTQQKQQTINENIENNVKLNYIVENFNQLAEDAMKDVITEMYAVERIKKVLTENKEIIKSIVYETIRELQAKNKK